MIINEKEETRPEVFGENSSEDSQKISGEILLPSQSDEPEDEVRIKVFKPKAHILTLLGDELIKNPVMAIYELVKKQPMMQMQ